MNKTLVVNRNQCEEILSVEKCIPYMKKALVGISDKQAKVLQRIMIPHENGNMLANMPASLISENVTGSKVIIFPGPQTAKMGTNQGIIPLFNIETGRLIAIIDAELITVVRTAATSAAATDVLANKDSKTLAILGSGKQGKAHVQGMLAVRDIEKVYMWDLYFDAAKAACELMKTQFPQVKFIPCETAKEAVIDADIICTTTPGKTENPVLLGSWLKDGAHINAVGTCSARGRELDGEAVKKSVIFSDWTQACHRDAGDIMFNISVGELAEIPPMVEIGEVLSGRHPGRTDEKQITMFESVGISVEDIAAAKMIYEYAKENGIGTWLEI
ncbi:MAG: ornithine cyclodeaminase family protein [Oscillospiraceae bacterium]|nr:ornithine cyclodeaminase family protein [Oscillospiraceae bacterium]